MSELIERLRGKYVIPVNDGAGPLNGSMEFIRKFPTPPIHHEAADALEAQAKRIAEQDAEIDRAFGMLAACGVPKERAKTVANCIDVLTTRFRKFELSNIDKAVSQDERIKELEARLAQVEVDAGRYAEARKNPAGFNHLLSLMIKEQAEGKGDRAKALDVMMDRIIASRQNAIDAAKEQA